MTKKNNRNTFLYRWRQALPWRNRRRGIRKVIRDLRELGTTETAAMFSSLLTIPGLQSNCIRIEALVHLALATAKAGQLSQMSSWSKVLSALGDGYCGMMEDPSEDEFITLARTPSGNFRIFEGIWQGASFHLERILDVVESMPDREPLLVFGARSSITHAIGCRSGKAGLREQFSPRSSSLYAATGRSKKYVDARGFIEFTDDELARFGIAPASLSEFIFDPIHRSELQSQFVDTLASSVDRS